MKLSLESIKNKEDWKGYGLPGFDVEKVWENTKKNPTWLHFGAGNIFRMFPVMLCQNLLESGKADTGIICAEGYDDEIITKGLRPYDNLSVAVTLNKDGSVEKDIAAAIAESLAVINDLPRIKEIFEKESLQMVSFTITEKGYSLTAPDGSISPAIKADMENGPENPKAFMALLTSLCLHRYHSCKKPLALVSMDNCSHNGEKLKNAVTTIAKAWLDAKKISKEEYDYINDDIAYPFSMIDKITPRPDKIVEEKLKEDGIEDISPFITSKNTYFAAFVNAEKAQYLVIEDTFPNGRPALEESGVYFTDRATVNLSEKMKVTTCLNPLHTAMSVYGCMLGYNLICKEMEDEDIVNLIKRLGYKEGLPVVDDPKILDPKAFIDEVIEERLPNPFMPDAPQRIATDTSQKVGIRFGETIKSYVALKKDLGELKSIPLAIAGWLRYLLGVDDKGNAMEVSADPLKDRLMGALSDIKLGSPETYKGQILPILKDASIFGVDLVEVGLADKIEEYFKSEIQGVGAVRATLHKVISE